MAYHHHVTVWSSDAARIRPAGTGRMRLVCSGMDEMWLVVERATAHALTQWRQQGHQRGAGVFQSTYGATLGETRALDTLACLQLPEPLRLRCSNCGSTWPHGPPVPEGPAYGPLEELLEAAREHGGENADHEVGDLQDMLRWAYTRLSPDARREFVAHFREQMEAFLPPAG